MVPAEVCDGKDPVRSTFYGRDTDITVTRYPCIHEVERGLGVTVFGYGVDFEHFLDKRTPLPQSGGVWW